MTDVLALSGVSRRFGQVQALDGVDFTLRSGEIHALLGENGAGKSTLMNIAFGLVAPDAGAVSIHGALVPRHSPALARRLGVGMVHQHFTSIAELSVAENVALGAGWRFRPREVELRVERLGEELGLPVSPRMRVADLSAGLRQRVEVVKALAAGADILLLDEPSSVLSPLEAERLLAQLVAFRDRGISSVLITHKLREAASVADRVTVLRRGRVAYRGPRGGATTGELATHMLGEAPPPRPARPPAARGGERLVLESVGLARLGESGTGLDRATLTVRAGEVVGVAAVEGNGQRELLRLAAGLERPDRGSAGRTGAVSFIPEDRTTEGCIGEFSLTEHLVLAAGADAPWIAAPWVRWPEAASRAARLMAEYQIQAPSANAAMRELSGGNQQRMIIAAAMERRPALLVAENPTRGLDLRATTEVLDRLRGAAQRGVAVLVHLPDLDELLEVSDRIVVLAGGRMVEAPVGASRDEIGRMMLGEAP
ncbi:MAG: ATP-binding cassette domain-containing protein [Gemmatimonadota bacterium]|nr:ATP-binding cassette domain-containing protein [Gemmatimonadota bacterium]